MLIKSAPLANTVSALKAGSLDLKAYLTEQLNHIAQVEPEIKALLSESARTKRLLADAAMLLETYPDPNNRPPLFGALVGVKDIFRAKGFPTAAGSNLPPHTFAAPETACVTRLKKAGALVLGKTVTTEFAYFEPGPTRNPHNLKHTPGGSSSGSAAAVAAGYCPLALGTQTIGSVIRPAGYCGIVGFKPSYGRIDPIGLMFVSPSLDHVGLFTQDMAGMRLAAAVLCQSWRERGVATEGKKPVLGVPSGPYLEQASPEGLTAFKAQLARLEEAGYVVRYVPTLEDIEEIAFYHVQLMAVEMAEVHHEWFASYKTLYRPRTIELIQRGETVSLAEIKRAKAGQLSLRSKLHTLRQEARIDLWVAPAAPGPAPEGIGATGNPAMNLPWTYTGLPAVTIPAGLAKNGLPLGLQCVADFMRDEQLLVWAEEIEAVLG